MISGGPPYRGLGGGLVQVLSGPLPYTHHVTITVVYCQEQIAVRLKGAPHKKGMKITLCQIHTAGMKIIYV